MSEIFEAVAMRDKFNQNLCIGFAEAIGLAGKSMEVHVNQLLYRGNEKLPVVTASINPYGEFMVFGDDTIRVRELVMRMFKNKSHGKHLFRIKEEIALSSQFERELVQAGYVPIEQLLGEDYVKTVFSKILKTGEVVYAFTTFEGGRNFSTIRKALSGK